MAGENQNAAGSPPASAQSHHQERAPRAIPPVTVEFGDDCNRTITIDTLKARLRGKYSQMRRDAGAIMNRMPDIPGQRMTIDFASRLVRIFDPLENDKDLLSKINSVTAEATVIASGGGKFTFVTASEQKLNADELKTLIIEICTLVENKSAFVVDGTQLPSERAIESLPGFELFDVWNSGRKPKYKKDAEAYFDKMEREPV